MHGRVKTRTTEEEAAKKQKERAAKVVAYKVLSLQIFEMRKKGELNHALLSLIAQVLTSNPDIYTFWNIRREVLLRLAAQNEMNQADIAETQTLYDAELPLTENCLRINPKSYSAWHHRCWILSHAPSVNWDKELAICTKYLKMDERNFHCWDYRRFVVHKAQTTAIQELAFSSQKILDNFSNYSAWHYRSKLLPLLYSDKSNNRLCDSKLQEELELVLNAAFTDPADSSAWFYQRWLLGKAEVPLEIISAILYRDTLLVAMTKQVDFTASGEYIIRAPGHSELIPCEWSPILSTNRLLQTLWRGVFAVDVPCGPMVVLELVEKRSNKAVSRLELIRFIGNDHGCSLGYRKVKFGAPFGDRVRSELAAQLQACRSLIVLEPESKWTLLTSAVIMRALDHNKYHRESLEVLHRLQEVDPMRSGYYCDLRNRWIIENTIEHWIEHYDPADENKSVLDLHDLGLTAIYHKQFFLLARYVDLRGNDLCPKLMEELQSVFRVMADGDDQCSVPSSMGSEVLNYKKNDPKLDSKEAL